MLMRAILILAGIGTLAVMEIQTPPRDNNTVIEPPQLSIFARSESDELPKGDRLEIYTAQSAQPVSSFARTSTNVAALIPKQAPYTVEQRMSVVHEKKRVVLTEKPRPKPKIVAKIGPSKKTVETKLCRPNTFDGLLRALDLPYRCET